MHIFPELPNDLALVTSSQLEELRQTLLTVPPSVDRLYFFGGEENDMVRGYFVARSSLHVEQEESVREYLYNKLQTFSNPLDRIAISSDGTMQYMTGAAILAVKLQKIVVPGYLKDGIHLFKEYMKETLHYHVEDSITDYAKNYITNLNDLVNKGYQLMFSKVTTASPYIENIPLWVRNWMALTEDHGHVEMHEYPQRPGYYIDASAGYILKLLPTIPYRKFVVVAFYDSQTRTHRPLTQFERETASARKFEVMIDPTFLKSAASVPVPGVPVPSVPIPSGSLTVPPKVTACYGVTNTGLNAYKYISHPHGYILMRRSDDKLEVEQLLENKRVRDLTEQEKEFARVRGFNVKGLPPPSVPVFADPSTGLNVYQYLQYPHGFVLNCLPDNKFEVDHILDPYSKKVRDLTTEEKKYARIHGWVVKEEKKETVGNTGEVPGQLSISPCPDCHMAYLDSTLSKHNGKCGKCAVKSVESETPEGETGTPKKERLYSLSITLKTYNASFIKRADDGVLSLKSASLSRFSGGYLVRVVGPLDNLLALIETATESVRWNLVAVKVRN